MPIKLSELKWRGSASMPDDDTPVAIGGAIALDKKAHFQDVNGTVQGVSSAAGDTTQTITVSGRDATGAIVAPVITLNGLTAVTNAQSFERLLKAVKSATTTGDVAIEAQTAERTGTAQAGSADDLTLDTGASGVDGTYDFMVLRLTGGTGSGQIREIIRYTGADKKALVSRPWTVTPDATSVFRVSKGFYFDKSPDEIMQVRRPFYNAAANAPGGGAVDYHEKLFAKNTHGSLALLSAKVAELADPSASVSFALETTVNGTGTNGGGNNRKVAPSSGIGGFDSTEKDVPGTQLTAGQAIGVWLKLSLADGGAALKTTYTPRLKGNTV
jgi:hypothetical protein